MISLDCSAEQRRRLVDYLLQRLRAEQRVEIEDRCFRDPRYVELIRLVEQELIDDYVRGALAPKDERAFKQCYQASAALRREVEFAFVLRHSIASASS